MPDRQWKGLSTNHAATGTLARASRERASPLESISDRLMEKYSAGRWRDKMPASSPGSAPRTAKPSSPRAWDTSGATRREDFAATSTTGLARESGSAGSGQRQLGPDRSPEAGKKPHRPLVEQNVRAGGVFETLDPPPPGRYGFAPGRTGLFEKGRTLHVADPRVGGQARGQGRRIGAQAKHQPAPARRASGRFVAFGQGLGDAEFVLDAKQACRSGHGRPLRGCRGGLARAVAAFEPEALPHDYAKAGGESTPGCACGPGGIWFRRQRTGKSRRVAAVESVRRLQAAPRHSRWSPDERST